MRKVLLVMLSLAIACLPLFAGGQRGGTAASGPVDYGRRTDGPNYWMVKYDQPVTLHVANYEIANAPSLPWETGADNVKTRALKRYLNIDIVTDWITTQAGYPEKLNLAIAAGELPDVFKVNAIQFRQLVDAGLLADLTDYISNNASDYVKNIMEAAPAVTESAKINGRLMAIPNYGYGDLYSVSNLWIRHDWMKQAGLPAPRTIADLENIMKTFMTQHPGSYGMMLTKNLWEMYLLGSAFGVAQNIWVEGSDGNLVYGNIQPQMKDLVACWADWYQKGYLRKDFTSMEDTTRAVDVASGKAGVLLFPNYAGWTFTDVIKNYGPEAYLEPYEVPTRDGKPGVFPIGFDNDMYIVVNKNCKNIAAVIKSISFTTWVAAEAPGQGALTEDLLGGDVHHTFMVLEISDPYANGPELIEWAQEVGRNNGVIKTPPKFLEWQNYYELQSKPWVDSRDPAGYARWIQLFAIPSAASINLKIINEGRYIRTPLTGPLPEEAAAYGSTLDDLLNEGFTKIIVGDQPLSYFDTIVAQWKASGGDVITAAVNRVYGKK
ncbi:MAG: extracellular solute-binding protein [Treponema sp.]|jgi:putative aldouronate transport system substrate-binding protein|nr:extracellular solute-binding protein [Treponema sp.]